MARPVDACLLPDLTIDFDNVEVTSNLLAEKGKVKVVVTNQGEKRFRGPLDVNLYASTDSVLDLPLNEGNLSGKDELLSSLLSSRVNLAPGRSKSLTLNLANPEFRTPSVVAPGAYYLLTEVDPSNTISEIDENNNLENKFISIDGSDVIIDWNATALNAIQATGTPTLLASRSLAIVHAAIYDAVNAIKPTHKPYLVNVEALNAVGASPEAAAVEAAYQTLVQLLPTQKITFENQRTRSLLEVADGSAEDAGIALGKYVADQIIALRRDDGSDEANDSPYMEKPTLGVWRPAPPSFREAVFPQWGQVTPFAIPSGSTFRPDGFPALETAEYAGELNEVKALGEKNSAVRTTEQTEIAKFWSFGRPDTFTSPGQWNKIAQEVALQQGNTLAENARLFALLNIAEVDAGIAAYDAKYTYDRWRPITAIREADVDGNPDTIADPNWEPLLDTPPHPDYLAAHSVFGAAAGKILADFFGDDTSSSVTSQELPGISRSYSSFTQAAEESGISRIYGGVHFQSANLDGLTTGGAVADYVSQNFLV